jgi:hypothetical protein
MARGFPFTCAARDIKKCVEQHEKVLFMALQLPGEEISKRNVRLMDVIEHYNARTLK